MALSREKAGRYRWFAALAAVALGLLGSAPTAEAIGCNNQVIRDYAKPLERLPQLRAVPFGEPRFFPARVFLGSKGRGPLQLGSAERGFRISYSPYEVEATKPTRRLDWRVTSRLVRLDRRGQAIGEPEVIEKRVKRLWPTRRNVDFAFEVSGKPALYRLELVFDNRGGKRLARFGENFRVLRPSLDVDVVLNGTDFRRGETVEARLLNRGAAFLHFGLGRHVEYFDGSAWTAAPAFRQGPIPAIGLSLGPGESGSCWGATIPSETPAGLYRFAIGFDYLLSSDPGERTSATASSEFTVLP